VVHEERPYEPSRNGGGASTLNADTSIGIHFGTFANLTDEGIEQPLKTSRRHWPTLGWIRGALSPLDSVRQEKISRNESAIKD
jgi:hypothetical protein